MYRYEFAGCDRIAGTHRSLSQNGLSVKCAVSSVVLVVHAPPDGSGLPRPRGLILTVREIEPPRIAETISTFGVCISARMRMS